MNRDPDPIQARARPPAPRDVAILCRVIDNLGDAGVCWRLARQLADEHACRVTLFIDDVDVLARLVPAAAHPARASGAPMRVAGVDLVRWPPEDAPSGWQAATHAHLVIAAFGCTLPAPVRERLAALGEPTERTPPVWINLEYLSAEPWTDDANGTASIKPADRAVEWFVFPGFGERSAGLLRERSLLARRDAFRATGEDRRWLRARGVDPAQPAGGLLGSLFAYDTPLLAAALADLADGPHALSLLVPEGVGASALGSFFGRVPMPGEALRRGRLTVHAIAWLEQSDYDHLLWSCDLNLVRGEDSWVRAHWAGRPFLWQPYRQPDDAHQPKLDAWLDRLLQDAPAPLATDVRAAGRAWAGAGDLRTVWPAFVERVVAADAGRRLYGVFADRLAARTDLATWLLQFAASKLA